MDDAKAIQQLKQQVQTLEKQVKELEKLSQFIKVTGPELIIDSQMISINSGSTMNLKGSIVNINADSAMNLKGSIMKLNNGSKPAARLGSKTAGTQTMQTVVDGSPTVLLP